MAEITALWLPILVSAVVVFFASWIIHTLLPWHRKDFPKVPNEDRVMDAIRPLGIPPGEYMIPRVENPKDMKSPEFQEKLAKGPVLMMNVLPPGPFSMGKSLFQWFVYCIVISIFAAYIAGRAFGLADGMVPPDDVYGEAFRFAGASAFAGYALALPQASIWYKRSWGLTFRSVIDGLIYGLLTGGVFGALWPQ
ncbi:MAG: hypothetical protein ACT4PM_12155 [Gemmatimonadales bacterium]